MSPCYRRFISAVAIVVIALTAGCASQRQPDRHVDAIFNAVPGGRYQCYNQSDNRNIFVKGATSTAGQAAAGGALGGLIGNQFGAGRGQNIATGVGAAAGLAAGAWNAQRMKHNRLDNCRQSQGYNRVPNNAG